MSPVTFSKSSEMRDTFEGRELGTCSMAYHTDGVFTDWRGRNVDNQVH